MNLKTLKQIGFVFIGVALGLGWSQCSLGDISLPKIFSDHMVLQRNSRVKIWGTAEPGQKLVIRFAGKEIKVTAKDNGDWVGYLQTLNADGPYELEIVAQNDELKVMFSDVWVGEVWVCSGQSNMELSVSNSLNATTEIERSKQYPMLRLFTVGKCASPQPQEDFAKVDAWNVCSPETVKDFSAVAYYFGREMSKELKDIRIGLIDASTLEGSVCEAWVSRKSMDKIPELAEMLKNSDESHPPGSANRPASLFNGMVSPMTGFRIRGVIWYQGEANIGRGAQLQTLFPALISDWREAFGSKDMPFFFVQLAPFRYKNNSPEDLAEVWDAQLKTLKSVPHTGMVVTTDIGNVNEFKPKNKQAVGRRLALIALANVYKDQLPEDKQKIVFSGPIFDAMSIHENQIRLTFKHANGGLGIRNDEPELTCFTICGKDRKFHPAVAKIDGNFIEVSSPEVAEPVAVRFGWDDCATPNLTNAHDFPASPFRTDDFPLLSEGINF